MQQTVLYKLIQEARAENKAVKLVPIVSEKDLGASLIIEPEHEIKNEEYNIISSDGCLIDLNFVACAVIIPNREERLKEEQDLWDRAVKQVLDQRGEYNDI